VASSHRGYGDCAELASVDPTGARKFIVTYSPTAGPAAVREYHGRRCAAGWAWDSKSTGSNADW
jgi:hypothetical protein